MLNNLDFDQNSEYCVYENYVDYVDYVDEQECIDLPVMGISDIISSGLYYASLKIDNVANAARRYVSGPLDYVTEATIGGLKTAGNVAKYPIDKVSNAWHGVKSVGSNFLDTHKSLNKIMHGINSQAGKNFFSKLLNIDFDGVKRMMTLAGLSISQIMQMAQIAANIATQLEAYLTSLTEATQIVFLNSVEFMRFGSIMHLRKKMHQIKQVLHALKPSKINQSIQQTANIGFKIYDKIFNNKEYKPLEYLQ